MKARKEIKIYGDMLFAHKPTIRSLVLNYLYSKFVKREKGKSSIYRDNQKFVDRSIMAGDLETKTIAIVLDGTVVEILRMQAKAANFLMDEKADLIEFSPEEVMVQKGYLFDGEKFSK